MSFEVEGRRPLDGRSLLRIPLAIVVIVGACVVGFAIMSWTDGVVPSELVLLPAFFGGISLAYRVTRLIRPSTNLGRVKLEGGKVSIDEASFDNAGVRLESADRSSLRLRDAVGALHVLPRTVVPLSGVNINPLSSWELDVVDERVVLVNIVPRGKYQPPERRILQAPSAAEPSRQA